MSGCSCTCASCSKQHYVHGRPLDGYDGQTNVTARKRFVKISNHRRSGRDSNSVGGEGVSARTFAIDEDGGLWAWGFGPVGDGTMIHRECPTFIDHGPWKAVSDGFGIKEDGTLWCIAGNHGLHAYTGPRGIVGGSVAAVIAGGVEVTIGDPRRITAGFVAVRGLYCTPPTIRIDPPQNYLRAAGRQATAVAVLQCHAYAVTVTSGGSGYTSAPTVTVPMAPSVELEAEVVGGSVVAVRILDRGSFKLRGAGATVPAVQFSGGGGSGAAATLVPMGHLHDVEMTDYGDGYEYWAAQGVTPVRDPNDQVRNYYDYPSAAYIQLVKRAAPPQSQIRADYFTRPIAFDRVDTIGTLTNEPVGRVPVIEEVPGLNRAYITMPESNTAMLGAVGRLVTYQGHTLRTGVTDPPEVEVYTPGRGSGASLRVETITSPPVNGLSVVEHRIHVVNRGSGYEFTPHIKVQYTFHNDSLRSNSPQPGDTLVTDSKSKTIYRIPHWEIDGHPTPMPTPRFHLGDEPAGSAVATSSRVTESGRMTPKRKTLEVTGIGVTSTTPLVSAPYIYNSTGLVLSPTPMSEFHSDLGGKWLDVQGFAASSFAGLGSSWGRAINDRGEVWVWGYETTRRAWPSVAPMPIGGEITGGTLQDAGRYPPPPRGRGAYLSEFGSTRWAGYLFSPGDNLTYHPPLPVSRFWDVHTTSINAIVFAAFQANGNLVFWRQWAYHRGWYTDEQYEWCTSSENGGVVFAKRKNGRAFKFSFDSTVSGVDVKRPIATPVGERSQLHAATSAKNMTARLQDGSVIDFDIYGLTTRYVAGTEARVTKPGSGYRQAAIVDEPTSSNTPSTQWPVTLTGGVYGVDVENPGEGYQSPPAVTFSGGAGSGAAAEAVIEGPVVRVDVTNGGSGYTRPPLVRFSRPGVFAEATAEIDLDGRVTHVSVQHGGRYRSAPQVFFDSVDGAGSGAAATAVIDGSIQFVRVTSVGSYQGGPAATAKVNVHITGATAHAIMLYEWADGQTPPNAEHHSNNAVIYAATAPMTPYPPRPRYQHNIFFSGPYLNTAGTLQYPYTVDPARHLFYTKPKIWRQGDELLAAVTELGARRQTFSHPLQLRYPYQYGGYDYETAPGMRVIVQPGANGSPYGQLWNGRVWHDGPATMEITNVLGQGVHGTAQRGAGGEITSWSFNTSQATPYVIEAVLPYWQPNHARVTLPPEGRPAAATAQVSSHTEGGTTYYTVTGITINNPGKFLAPPRVYLQSGDLRIKCAPVMVRGIQSFSAPNYSPGLGGLLRTASTVLVGGGEITPATFAYSSTGASIASGGAYTGTPRLYRGGRTLRVTMTRYSTIHAIENPQPTIRWPSPPSVVIETNEQPTVERWFGYATPFGAPLVARGVIESVARYDTSNYGDTQFIYGELQRRSLESNTMEGDSRGNGYLPPFVLRSASRGRIVGARIYNEVAQYYPDYDVPRFRAGASIVPTYPEGRADQPNSTPNRLPARVYYTHGWAAIGGHITVTRPVWDDLLDDIILQRQ